MKVKEESEKVGLKFNIQKKKIMASGPITSWEIDGETVEAVSDFIFMGSKFTADGDCSHEIKRRLLLGRKVLTNLDSILKSRDIMLPTKFRLVKAMVFPVVMYGCESWTVKLSTEELMLLNCGVGEDSTHGHHQMVNTEIRLIIFFAAKDGEAIQSAKTRLGADCGSDHELLIAKFRLKLKKVGKTTRPFRYDLNQIPYDYTEEVRNRFKGLDLIDRVPNKLWMEVRDTV